MEKIEGWLMSLEAAELRSYTALQGASEKGQGKAGLG